MTMGIQKHFIRVAHVAALVFAIAGLSMLALAGTRAAAQDAPYIDTSHPNIIVDLTVLEDRGYTPVPTVRSALSPLAGGQLLLMPGAKFPVSQLHVPPPAGSVQSMPFKAETGSKLHVPSPTETATAPPPATAPEKPPVTAAEELSSLTPPPPPVETTQPAPPPAPETVAVAKAEPVAPPPPAVEKVEVPKAAPEPEPKATEQASLPAAGAALKPGEALEVVFPPSASKLPATAKKVLKSLAARLKGEDGLRLQLMAYAGGKALSASKARRLSLSRALAVRSYLIENGVRSTRIDVRALGDKTDKASDKPVNRVDINVVER